MKPNNLILSAEDKSYETQQSYLIIGGRYRSYSQAAGSLGQTDESCSMRNHYSVCLRSYRLTTQQQPESAAVQKTAAILANVVRAVAVNVVSDAVLPKLLEP